MLHSNVHQPMIKWCSLMQHPLYSIDADFTLHLTACFRYFSQSYKEINYWPGFHHSDCLADPCKFSLWPERFIFWFWKRCDSVDRCSTSDKRRYSWFELWFDSGISCHRRLWNRLPRNPREYEAESLRSRIHLSLQSSAVPWMWKFQW